VANKKKHWTTGGEKKSPLGFVTRCHASNMGVMGVPMTPGAQRSNQFTSRILASVANNTESL